MTEKFSLRQTEPIIIVRALEVLTLLIVLIGFVGLFSAAIYRIWDYKENQEHEQGLDGELEPTKDVSVSSDSDPTDVPYPPPVDETDTGQDPADGHVNMDLTEPAVYIATALSGFMMAFFANRMGIEPDANRAITQRKNAKKALGTRADNKFPEKQIAKYLYGKDNYQLTTKSIGSIYMVVYFVIALAAIVTWIYEPENPPNAFDVIKNVASISVTMFIGIAKGVLDTIDKEA